MDSLQSPIDPQFFALQEALAGKYSLESELGRGGMGVVYLAQDVQLDRPVALKVLPQEFAARAEVRDRFLREGPPLSLHSLSPHSLSPLSPNKETPPVPNDWRRFRPSATWCDATTAPAGADSFLRFDPVSYRCGDRLPLPGCRWYMD